MSLYSWQTPLDPPYNACFETILTCILTSISDLIILPQGEEDRRQLGCVFNGQVGARKEVKSVNVCGKG
jgi:hypothetical protein